jgi:hypothetical protein
MARDTQIFTLFSILSCVLSLEKPFEFVIAISSAEAASVRVNLHVLAALYFHSHSEGGASLSCAVETSPWIQPAFDINRELPLVPFSDTVPLRDNFLIR